MTPASRLGLSGARVEVELEPGDASSAVRRASAAVRGPGSILLTDSVEVTLEPAEPAGTAGWSVANVGRSSIRVRSVAIVFRLHDAQPPLKMLRHGYQSWSPSDVAVLGVDEDPSHTPGSLELVRAGAHADQRIARPGELRSEWVTVLTSGDGSALLVGFDGGSRHDGTLRLAAAEDVGPAAPSSPAAELRAEAFLGGAVLAPGARRELHALVVRTGETAADAAALLAQWGAVTSQRGSARREAPYQAGWCTWYHYFHDVTETDVMANLAKAGADGWPFSVFQVDDGYQAAIGDWLTTSDRFAPGANHAEGVARLAAAISEAGYRAGLWLAPFLVAPDSAVATEHPGWVARMPGGEDPLPGSFNPPWGGGLGGLMWTLDTTHPEVQAHLEEVARALREMGFSYLKLDFTYAPSFDGVWHDATMTPAERVRAGYEAVRRGAGDDAFLLGCGAPLSNVVGLVDGMRIGADVAPAWNNERRDRARAGYLEMLPATRHAAAATFSRAFMHRRLWCNDPDCVMLRQEATAMTPEQVETWAQVVERSGGMAIVSDDLSLLNPKARARFERLLDVGRAVDAEALAGRGPWCDDLMSSPEQPSGLSGRTGEGAAAAFRLQVDAPGGGHVLREGLSG
ncbi:MAG TPA: glycoside hydrolase family 36 protein [Acidimicrobiales bacterium]|nr:glycoside hydrolase family 36 protein [Acidimicrobiales bacterium]